MELIGFIDIQEGLPLKGNCLGKSFPVNIGAVSGILMTPLLPSNYSENGGVGSLPLIEPDSKMIFGREGDKFGRTVRWPDGDSFVTRFILIFSDLKKNQKKIAEKEISKNIQNWLERLRENFFGIGYNIESRMISEENKLIKSAALFSLEKGSKHPKGILDATMKINVSIPNFIDQSKFGEIIKITSSGMRLRLEYQFLKDADTELSNGNLRKSVLDSATALEIGLKSCLKNELNMEQKLFLEVMSNFNSINKRRELLKHTSIKLPNYGYKENLEDLRNRAIHSGYNPSVEEATKAYKIVKDTLPYLIEDKFSNDM